MNQPCLRFITGAMFIIASMASAAMIDVTNRLGGVFSEAALDMRATAATGDMTLRITNGLFKAVGHMYIGERGSPPAPEGARLIIGRGGILRAFEQCIVSDRPLPASRCARRERREMAAWYCGRGFRVLGVVLGRQNSSHGSFIVDGTNSVADFQASEVAGALAADVYVGTGGTSVIIR